MRKLALAIVILALTSSVAMAGVVHYHGSRDSSKDDSKHKSANCEYSKKDHGEYERGNDEHGKDERECED
jgi:hypothetical protein